MGICIRLMSRGFMIVPGGHWEFTVIKTTKGLKFVSLHKKERHTLNPKSSVPVQ